MAQHLLTPNGYELVVILLSLATGLLFLASHLLEFKLHDKFFCLFRITLGWMDIQDGPCRFLA